MTPREIMSLPESERRAAIEAFLRKPPKYGVTTYKVYWKDQDGEGFTFIEVSDEYGRRKAAEARRIFKEQYGGEITKVVKDC